MRSVRRWVAAAVMLPLVVAGCSDDPKPEFTPPSETPSPTETSSPPKKEAWEVKSEKGAVAFAKHWMAVFSDAMRDGQTMPLLELSASGCETCSGVVDRLDSIYSDGGRYESNGWRVLQADAATGLPADRAVVAMRVLRTAEMFQDTAHGPKQSNPASKASYSAHVKWVNGGWLMQRLDLVG